MKYTKKIWLAAVIFVAACSCSDTYAQFDDKSEVVTSVAATATQAASYPLTAKCVIIKADINNTATVFVGTRADILAGRGFQMNANDQTQKCTSIADMNFLWILSASGGQLIYISGN